MSSHVISTGGDLEHRAMMAVRDAMIGGPTAFLAYLGDALGDSQ